jgi:hypothetical protein
VGWRNKLRKHLIIYSESDESNLRMKEKMKKKTVNIRPQNNFLFFFIREELDEKKFSCPVLQ